MKIEPSPRLALAALLVVGTAACATVASLLGIQEPRFAPAANRASTLRIDAPTISHPRGAATVRVWAEVVNPNAFTFTLSNLAGQLALEGKDLVEVDLPLGLPLAAQADTIVPLDLTFGFESLGSLGSVATALLTRSALDYELKGTIGVNAGPLGTPTLGPRTWLRGSLQVQNPLSPGR